MYEYYWVPKADMIPKVGSALSSSNGLRNGISNNMALRCIQIHTQHAEAASTVMANKFVKKHLVDIPFIKSRIVSRINALLGELVYCSPNAERPSACLMVDKNIFQVAGRI